MNILYILGNGFDKAQGMKTSYPEFYEYLMKEECSPLLERMKKDINADKKLWSEMEKALGIYTSKVNTVEEMDRLHDELSQHLQEYLIQEDRKYIPTNRMQNKISYDLRHPDSYLAETDRETYTKYVQSNSKNSSDINCSVMTFNYTNTFENILSLTSSNSRLHLDEQKKFLLQNVIHIHGQLDDTIIIGVDNSTQIENDKIRDSTEIRNFLIKVDANAAMKTLRHKKCEHLIEKANLIVFFGVSFGETDIRWWKLIGNEFKKRNDIGAICFLYFPDEIPKTRKFKLTAVEQRERKKLYSKMGVYPSEDVDNRFFITLNSSMFNK